MQRYTSAMKLIQTLLVVGLIGLSFAASAQWQWLDKDGRKVYSDRAPPVDIQDKNILKRPGNYKAPVTPAANAAGESDGSTQPASAPVPPALPASGGMDKELEAKKKQAKEAEVAKRKAEEERIAKAKIESCARAKQAKAMFDSGVRVGHTNAAGEREVMDDATRAAEMKRIQAILASDCK